MAQSSYLRRVQAINRNQQPDDVARGLLVGQEIGKLLGGLGTAIQGAQKNAIANKLMTDADIANQPGAGQTINLGTLPGGPQPAAGSGSGGSGGGSGPDPDPDPTSVTYPSGGGINPDAQPTYTTEDMPDLSQAVGQQKAAASLNSQPAPQSSTGDFTLNPSDYSGSGKTAGSLVHTGGVQELELMKEMQAMQAQKATSANTQAEAALKLADLRAKASGTGIYSMDAAIKRAQLMKEQASLQPKTVKPDKNAPPVNINSEPVDNDNQLNTFVNKQYGNGTSEAISSLVSDGSKEIAQEVDAQGNPVIDPATGQPKLSSTISVPLGKNKSANIPLQELQTVVNQKNALRKKQGLPLFRVPGQDQSLGATQSNPYPVTSKLDALSRASGTWVRLPNGQIAQVP